eukprot:909219_1
MAQQDEKQEQKYNIKHDQPLVNPQPSITPAENFDNDIATAAAKKLRGAMKGMGTNERKIIEVTNGFSHAQRMQILATFNKIHNRDLIKDFKSELSGKFEKMILGFWSPQGLFDAQQVNKACEGMGTNEALLTEIICTRNSGQLEAMQKAWWKGKSIIETVKSETKKMMGNSNYCNLLITLLEGGRTKNGPPPNEQKAKEDAEILNRFASQEKEKDAKAKFVEILSTRSWSQIREMSGIFQDISKKYTLEGAIQKTFGNGDTANALLVIVEFACQPYDYWAKKLRSAMKGMGTDDETMRRIIVSRAEIDLRDIGVIFGQRYGDGKTLQKWIKDDLGGD